MKRLKQLPEFVRFVMVGIFATALHYGLYFVLQWVINVNIAYTLGYALSFIANFYLTAYFTFGRKPSWRKAFGFGGAHLCSYLLHMGLLNLSLWMGIPKPLAPIPVFAIAFRSTSYSYVSFSKEKSDNLFFSRFLTNIAKRFVL